MQGSQRVIDALNDGLTIELTAINQYFCQAKMCKNWGLNKLAAHHYEESIDEMKHAELLIDRILFLDGVPEIARYDVIRVGTDVKEQLENDLAIEKNASETYNNGVVICMEDKDSASREVMEQIIRESEDSIDWLEAQLDLIEKIGIENYMLSQMGEDGGD
ncbi:MAG: bacterioferritin [Planctomycetota bacterium]|nr:MAG: bacterioferritin [Planctomycetota bacterium]REJ92242.1 MAG: bacterioferritin [Planctomycetota bacterium]REK27357.1 MAG: bacterioferritin [Planctomycetota bacterium]REK36621.1 MAG: bacterioferritin [Planctomycetota bacterium]